ncbi:MULTISPECIES: ArsA family ATPase [Dethiosulfovibrio]|jgi:arsenite-transporting ATPase|uniref:ArsA family ATPase n=2 Tax=Dethiosulfovibrio TaxID=47054 RepID=A0ABS9EJF9_9BACT|nr:MULTISPECIES: ArsA family ATPase [Dethiosulfovibrio]MCF4112873.1 ArsA family ATPase [Dethiosulfovibrio russensis]MCF4141337.1 ArsA family ATPase [Dethiosulfovibrio marinus]MCF4145667.1 ArsA family ATPase [Dethiosulfovibrio acidaminovorans]MEA3284600.1 ArsA family ATPase [Synergistota bacterium]
MYRRYTFFGGKGGTGKTTCAASYALSLARRGVRTLVVSTDPAHSLADAIGSPIGSEVVEVEKNLWALEIDAELEAKKYMESIQQQMLHIVSAAIVEEIKRQLRIAYLSPGAEEAAIFDRFIDLMEEAGDKYDVIVFDTAPTGHTLRLLTLPEVLEVWIDHLIKKRTKAMDLMRLAARYEKELQEKLKDDPIFNILSRRRDRFQRAKDLLTDHDNAVFHFVLNAEKMPILETERAIKLLKEFDIKVGSVVVNRIIPPEAGAFFEKRREAQEGYLKTIDEKFGEYGIVRLPMLESDIQGVEQLESISESIKEVEEL